VVSEVTEEDSELTAVADEVALVANELVVGSPQACVAVVLAPGKKRIRELPFSETYALPFTSKATPMGLLKDEPLGPTLFFVPVVKSLACPYTLLAVVDPLLKYNTR
jgi:hypothetical protein